MTDKRIVLCTAGSEQEARKIAEHLVEQRLAACVNIVPRIEWIYRWQENVGSSPGWFCPTKKKWRNCQKGPTPSNNCIPTNFRSALQSALMRATPPTWNGSANQ